MRAILDRLTGTRVYAFTTFGAVYAGVLEKVLEDVVQMRGADGKLVFVNVADVSGCRPYDEAETR